MDAVAKEKKQKKEFKKRLRFLINQNDFKGAADYLTENRLKHGLSRTIYIPDPTYEKLSIIEIAVKYGSQELFDACLPSGAHQGLQNNRGFTLEYWTMLHNFKWPSNLTTTFGHAYKNPNYQGTTFDNFALACANGHLNVLEQLIAKHKHVDYYYSEFTKSNRLLFEIAAMFDRAEVLKSLLEFATVRAEMIWDHRCDFGNVLHIAARLGHVRIVNVLVEVMKPTSEQLEERDQYEHTAMSLAVLHMHAPVVEALAKAGANMKGEFGLKKETLFDIIFSSDAEARQEYLLRDKTILNRIILFLAEQNPEALETLSQERRAKIDEIKQLELPHNVEVQDPVEEDDETGLPSVGAESDEEEEKIDITSPGTKKKQVECTLCDKKFTSEISLKAHLKSKGHIKQENKQRLQKKFEVVTPEKTAKKQQEIIGLIERLPLLSELINLIIIKLDKWSLLKFAATSKSIQMLVEKHNFCWRKIEIYMTDVLWKKSHGKIFEPVKRVMSMVERIRYIETNSSWELKNQYLTTIFDIPKYCPNLRELDIRKIDPSIPMSFLSALFQNCPKLRVLKMADVLAWKTSKKEAVEKGELTQPEEEQPEPVVNPKKPWKKKKVKKVKRPDPKQWVVKIEEVMQHGSNSLEELSIMMPFQEHVPTETYAKLVVGVFKKCPNLTQLKIEASNMDNVQSSTMKLVVESIFESLPKLKRLKLMGEWLFGRLPQQDYEAIFRKFNKIEKLQLEGSEIASFDREIHETLGECSTNLKELVICHNGEIGIDGPHMGLASMTNLTKLGFYSWSQPAADNWDLFLHTITARCTNIQHLETALPWNERLGQGLTPIASKLKVFKQKYWHTTVDNPPYSMLVKCANLTMIHVIKISLRDFHTVIDHCKFLEIIHAEIYPSNVPPEPDPNVEPVAQPVEADPNNNNENNNNNDGEAAVQVENNNNNNANNNEVENNNENNNNAPQNNGENNNNENNNNNEPNNNNNNNVVVANNNEPNNNNNNAIVVNAVPEWTVIDMGRIFEKCKHVKNLHLVGPMTDKSFSNFVVSTSLKKLTQLSTEDRIVSDMVVFYLSECCPNLEFVELDYSFCVSEWIELPFTRRLSRLKRFEVRHAYTLNQAFTNANKERACKIKVNS
jgi:hypothetical protein